MIAAISGEVELKIIAEKQQSAVSTQHFQLLDIFEREKHGLVVSLRSPDVVLELVFNQQLFLKNTLLLAIR